VRASLALEEGHAALELLERRRERASRVDVIGMDLERRSSGLLDLGIGIRGEGEADLRGRKVGLFVFGLAWRGFVELEPNGPLAGDQTPLVEQPAQARQNARRRCVGGHSEELVRVVRRDPREDRGRPRTYRSDAGASQRFGEVLGASQAVTLHAHAEGREEPREAKLDVHVQCGIDVWNRGKRIQCANHPPSLGERQTMAECERGLRGRARLDDAAIAL
jgi:hypothetical protein